MITVTKKDIMKFLRGLPPEHTFNMMKSKSSSREGCLMVQYGKSQGWRGFQCGLTKFFKPRFDNEMIARLNMWIPSELFYYKHITAKELIRRLKDV